MTHEHTVTMLFFEFDYNEQLARTVASQMQKDTILHCGQQIPHL